MCTKGLLSESKNKTSACTLPILLYTWLLSDMCISMRTVRVTVVTVLRHSMHKVSTCISVCIYSMCNTTVTLTRGVCMYMYMGKSTCIVCVTIVSFVNLEHT